MVKHKRGKVIDTRTTLRSEVFLGIALVYGMKMVREFQAKGICMFGFTSCLTADIVPVQWPRGANLVAIHIT